MILSIFQNIKISQSNCNLQELNIFINIMFLTNICTDHFEYFHSCPMPTSLPGASRDLGPCYGEAETV